MKKLNPDAISNLLPREVRQELMVAASLDDRQPPGTSPARIRAIEEAVQRAKRRYPKLFKE